MNDCLNQQKRALMTEYLYAQAHNIGAGNMIAACLLTAIYWTLLPAGVLVIWLLAESAVQGYRAHIARAYRLRDRYADTAKWYKLYANLALGNGCLWGIIAVVIAQQCSADQLAYLLMVLGALVACCSMSTGGLQTIYNRFAMPALLLPGLYLLSQIGTDKFMIGVLVLCWFVLMYSTAWRFNKFSARSLGFECENIALIRDLEVQKVRILALRENITLQEQIIEKLRETRVYTDSRTERAMPTSEAKMKQTSSSALRLVKKE